MNVLKIIAMLLAVIAVVSAAGCTEKAQVAGNETQEASEHVTIAAAPTTSVSKSVPSVTPSAKNNTDLTSSTVVDVVCKMKINKRTAEFTSKYKGTTYYFCALSCKKEFDENPDKYLNSENTENETQEASEQIMSAATKSADSTSLTVVDVVCKMEIDKRTVEFTSGYKGTTYYFCALSCKNEFDENPEKYINSRDTENENTEASEQMTTQEVSEQGTSAATNDTNSTSSIVVDVVCKMQIDKRTAEFTSEYKGITYYFCSASCKKGFDENPEKYINSETTENNSETKENETQETSEKETSEATNSTNFTSSTVVDVVCKMQIDKRAAEFTSEYKGTTYYFCALSCKKKFDENPEKYINSETTENETQKNCKTTENETQETSEKGTLEAMNSTNSTTLEQGASEATNSTNSTTLEQGTSAATNSTGSTSSTIVDVVCKMQIDERTAEFTSEYKGTTYYFCALSCKKEFDENPEKYINSEIIGNETQVAYRSC